MTSHDTDRHHQAENSRRPRFRLWRQLARSKDGAAAIEFAILAIPYFMIIFAIIETFVAFAAEQLVTNAVNTLGRQMRTGQITYQLNRPSTDMDMLKFRKAFCDEVNIMIQCSETEISTPSKLYIDARTFASFGAIPKTIPRVSTATFADIDPTSFKFTPGGPSTINMLRAYYRWQVITDLIRPYITTIRPSDGSMPSDFLIVATTAFQNENYP
ncbi:pilus assembly protein [Rhizobium sp. WL3]|uniref:TadE/TadG family type IV pilus assembly protein n=1 Tax=Rhizobium sp. WL3 TaxID=2603277 RepID=UPI0011C201DC|nr:TadE/TadG family type IV pilus assembly protein [Rhizobium sp. WL3]QEE46026.1 pilus assembly protein [Rhizobium sp. WL3]